jgi:hypothetical protein
MNAESTAPQPARTKDWQAATPHYGKADYSKTHTFISNSEECIPRITEKNYCDYWRLTHDPPI